MVPSIFNNNSLYTPEELMALADDKLSYFDNPNSGTAMNNETMLLGVDNAFISFPKAGTFANEAGDGARQVTLSISNPSATLTRSFKLFAGLDIANWTEMPGQIDDGTFAPIPVGSETYATLAVNGADAAKRLSCDRSGGGLTVRALLKYLRQNPTRLITMKITSESSGQLSKFVSIKRINPFTGDVSDSPIKPLNTQTSGTFNDKIAIVNVNEVIGQGIDVEYELLPNETVSIDFIFGASLDTERALEYFSTAYQVAASGGGAPMLQDSARKVVGFNRLNR